MSRMGIHGCAPAVSLACTGFSAVQHSRQDATSSNDARYKKEEFFEGVHGEPALPVPKPNPCRRAPAEKQHAADNAA